jgi:DNA-3-methyladenine glycosylase
MTDSFVLLAGDAVEVAPRLLGCLLIRELEDGTRISGRIVETEAYHQSDAASHSYKGKTPRTEIMFGPPGFVYVYFTYGMHYCVNVVTGPEGEGSAVLIRAIEPVEGIERMRANRGGLETIQLTNGPAKLCQALQIDKQLNGHDLHTLPLQLRVQPPIDASEIVTTTRIGITKDAHRPWRFYVAGNPFVSKL